MRRILGLRSCTDGIWKQIERDELRGRYEVSSLGRVRLAVYIKPCPAGYILSQSPSRKGYPQVRIRFANKRKWFAVHKLVAEAFIGPCPEGKEVNHCDGIKPRNYVDNLEYLTPKQNTDHAKANGLYANGERNGIAKLSEADVWRIRELGRDIGPRGGRGKRKITRGQISQQFGISQRNVSSIVRRESWSHL